MGGQRGTIRAVTTFETAYSSLNSEQKRAVDHIDGPLLVLAGPGTGKTQLLSARVANILKKTDTLPQNILCLTFTDAASLNMRERLTGMIGEAAYDVHINTYHSFSSEIIRTYPEFFEKIDLETGEDSRLERPINELGQLEIITQIIDKLPFTDPLRNARYYVRSVVSTISDLKQANIKPADLERITRENAAACQAVSPRVNEAWSAYKQMPRKAAEAISLFQNIFEALQSHDSTISTQATNTLRDALAEAEAANSTKPLTAWKNDWLEKDEQGSWTFTSPSLHERMLSLARIYASYQRTLTTTGQYDFDDMILQTIDVLVEKPELKFNLQERYQYILLDEFQDTNAAQFELVRLLADHPVHEGRPNIMAVGDDDQGIYAFQGADIGNMLQFLAAFRDVEVINLVKNYRSHHDILHTAHNIAEQIESRLHHNLQNVTKDIVAASDKLPEKAHIARHEFNSQAAEFGWIAEQIAEQVQSGIDASEIAVLAPRHAILESLVPFLNARGIPVSYEKRENIFETPVVQSILLTCEFLRAAKAQNMALMDELLPRVLSLEHWQIPAETIWQVNWQRHKEQYDTRRSWAELALEQPRTSQPVTFLLTLANQAETLGLEQVLDFVTGAKPLHIGEASYTSPLKEYYFSDTAVRTSSLQFFEAISHLSVIRTVLRDQQTSTDHRLTIDSLLDLYETYQAAEQPLINTHPIAQAESAVQLLTVYKAKGLEYQYVYLPCMHDDVWGSTARGSGNKLSLPYNLRHIRHESSGDDNLRRLLFVAITRAKEGLVVTSHALKESGKQTLPVKYMQESSDGDERIARALPDNYNHVIVTQRAIEQLQIDVDTLWHSRHVSLTPTLRSLLKDRLAHYVMSPTHLNTFTNVEYAGPQTFLLGTLLRFPEAQSPDSMYGNALHHALEIYQKRWAAGEQPSVEDAVAIFTGSLKRCDLTPSDMEIYLARGQRALGTYLRACGERLRVPAEIEADFRREGAVLQGTRLTGKIDRLEVDRAAKTLRIIDFKSGNPSTKWGSDAKYLNYKQQLYFYVLLAELSSSYKGYTVASAALEFIEPLPNGECAPPLELKFDQAEYDRFKQLILSVWQHIQELNLPDISGYAQTAAGMRQFEQDLISDKP